MLKKRKRAEAEIPTASMADIAFLLLIFFLVTTTIDVDTGILMQLPPPLDETQKPPPIKERNMLAILVNAQGDILVENEVTRLADVRREVVRHVTNNGVNPKYSEDPDHAIVSLKTDRKTNYDKYIDVLDEVWMGYREIWDGEARKLGFTDYSTYQESLGENGVDIVKDRVKAKISLAEPDAG